MAVFVLTLVAAFVSPLRQGCGTACIDPAAAHARVEIAAPQPDTSCHKPAPPPEPAPAEDHCSHDHSGSLRVSARAAVDANAGHSMVVAAFTDLHRFTWTPVAKIDPHDSPGSPPFLRNTPLRV